MPSRSRDLSLSGAGLDDPEVFELFAKFMLEQIAEEVAGTSPETPVYYGDPDGGIEAKVRAGDRTVGVQAKRYGRFTGEVSAIKLSFQAMLAHTQHEDVTDFVWCSGHCPTVNSQQKVNDVCAELEAEAAARGRAVRVHFWSEERMLFRLLQRDPEGRAVWTGSFEIRLRSRR